MIVMGADTHKGSHALAAVDDGTGKVRAQREITADDAGHLAAVRWARGLDDDRVWAIEDCRRAPYIMPCLTTSQNESTTANSDSPLT